MHVQAKKKNFYMNNVMSTLEVQFIDGQNEFGDLNV